MERGKTVPVSHLNMLLTTSEEAQNPQVLERKKDEQGGIYMEKVVFRLTPEKGKRTEEKAGLTGWNHVLNVVKKCSTDLEKVHSTRDLSAKISPEG